MYRITLAVILALSVGLAPQLAQASTDIQMLPPINCPASGSANGVLGWDGQNPLGCISGFTADPSGNIWAGNFTSMGSNSGFATQDRQDGNSNYSIFYRLNNVTALLDNSYGPVITYNTSGNVGIGTATPNSSLDMSTRTDAISVPRGRTAEEPASPTQGMTRFNTDTGKLEFFDGSTWVRIASAHPQIATVIAPYPPGIPYGPELHYLDCPEGFTEVSCNSIESPSGQYVCNTEAGINPGSKKSSCIQHGCNQGVPTDLGYYTVATCIKF